MSIPKYVQDLMSRSRYEFDFCKNHENYAAGYTLRIKKSTAYTKIDTFKAELERLVKWANKAAGCEAAYVLDIPTETHYTAQAATITIFDPIMQKIEKYIPET